MPNVLLTDKCTRACPYCFAREKLTDGAEHFMSLDNIIYLADFFARSRHKRFSLLGGEPTLHPDFPLIVKYLLLRRFQVRAFTNGSMAPDKCANLTELFRAANRGAVKNFLFVVNINEPSVGDAAEAVRLDDFLAAYGEFCMPGFNIYRRDFSMTFLLDVIERRRLAKSIRVGLAQPIVGRRNAHLDPRDYEEIGRRLTEFARAADEQDVRIDLDCGFPLCAFSDEQLGALHRRRAQLKFVCNVIIDIGPNMDLWPCFPLSAFTAPDIFQFRSLPEITAHFQKRIADELAGEPAVIYEKCGRCRQYKRGQCHGGCTAFAIARARRRA
jgi:MoaA/NifB/PqqE/SkfB family radical SAM enzyme